MSQARNQLHALSQQESPSPVLLVGTNGSGKHSIAEEVAREWSDNSALDFSDLQLVMSKEPTDGKMSIKELRDTLSLAPGSRQVVMIGLDGASIEVQNALLKRFEEPTSNTWLMAMVQDPKWVLPTMRSRCQTVRFQPLSTDQLGEWAQQQGIDVTPQQIDLAQGSSERLVWISQNTESLQALRKKDIGMLLQKLKEADNPGYWMIQAAELMPQLGWANSAQTQDLILRGAKPETVLAVAALA